MNNWHGQAYRRVLEGIEARLVDVASRHSVTVDFALLGMWPWFETEHPEAYKKYKAAEQKIEQLWIEGRTDSEAQKEFNAQLRIYRDGTYWLFEKYVSSKKDQIAKDRASAALVGTQEAMVMR